MSANILEIPDSYNRFRAFTGYNTASKIQMSEYITFVKVKKIIRAITDIELAELNSTIFKDKLNKFNKWTRDKIESKLSLMPHVKLMRMLYVREKDGVMDALLCLLNKKNFKYDQKFLTNFFKYGTALKDH
jgi:hypothetical protein